MGRKFFISGLIFCFVLLFCFSLNGQWAKSYGGTGDERVYSSYQTADGGYVVAGYTTSFGEGGEDILVIKLDSSGTIEWQYTYGKAGQDYFQNLCLTSDGGLHGPGKIPNFDGTIR